METVKKYAVIGVAVVLILLFGYLDYINSERDRLSQKLESANKKIDSINASIERTNQQLKTNQQLDKDYQEKLKNARIENDKLRNDLINNVKRVYVKADCPALPATPTTTSSTDAATPRLTGDARQDYLRLRQAIEENKEQTLKLQYYINNE